MSMRPGQILYLLIELNSYFFISTLLAFKTTLKNFKYQKIDILKTFFFKYKLSVYKLVSFLQILNIQKLLERIN